MTSAVGQSGPEGLDLSTTRPPPSRGNSSDLPPVYLFLFSSVRPSTQKYFTTVSVRLSVRPSVCLCVSEGPEGEKMDANVSDLKQLNQIREKRLRRYKKKREEGAFTRLEQ